jgi:small subunit ribosomal protein S16
MALPVAGGSHNMEGRRGAKRGRAREARDMPVRIRLRRTGTKNKPSYRVVVADSRAPRDGRLIENIGHYNPRVDPPEIGIDFDRALHWLRTGAEPSETVRSLLKKIGVIAAFEAERDALRRQKKADSAAAAPSAPEQLAEA